MSLKDKEYDIISLRSCKRTYVYNSEDVKQAVLEFEKILVSKQDFDTYARFKEIFGDFENGSNK